MKKLLCVALSLLMIVMAAAISVPASAADTAPDTLTVTVNGANPVDVKVGNEFLVFVGLYAGETKILDGQVHMNFDPEVISFMPYTADAGEDNDPDVEHYCFPASICNASLVMNYSTPGIINYNFTKANGIASFNTTTKRFARFRFKALAGGTADLQYIIQYMINTDEERIFYKNVPDPTINPYTEITVEPAIGCTGDADGDCELTVLDATFMQRVSAGMDLSYNEAYADVNGDKVVSLHDALLVRKHLAGYPVDYPVGAYQFASGKA